MPLLITGGTGFLGAYLTRYALSMGEKYVVVLDRYADRGRIADVLDRVILVEGDVSDTDAVRAIIAEHGIDRIAHFAFVLGSPATGQMINYIKVQALGTANVFECAREAGVKRVLFASSVAAYGAQDASLLDESLIPNPQSLYGASKVWAEAMAEHYTKHLNLEIVTVRYGSTYGLGRAWRGSYSSGLLPVPAETHYMARVEQAVRGVPITMPNSQVLADWTYGADAAQAAWLALTAENLPHHLYNVGAERLPVGDYTRAMKMLLPEAQIAVMETEMPGNAHVPMCAARLRDDLGFTPRYSLMHGLADYIERIRIADRYALESVRAS